MKSRIFLVLVYLLLWACVGCGINKAGLTVTELPCGGYSYGLELEK